MHARTVALAPINPKRSEKATRAHMTNVGRRHQLILVWREATESKPGDGSRPRYFSSFRRRPAKRKVRKSISFEVYES